MPPLHQPSAEEVEIPLLGVQPLRELRQRRGHAAAGDRLLELVEDTVRHEEQRVEGVGRVTMSHVAEVARLQVARRSPNSGESGYTFAGRRYGGSRVRRYISTSGEQ